MRRKVELRSNDVTPLASMMLGFAQTVFAAQAAKRCASYACNFGSDLQKANRNLFVYFYGQTTDRLRALRATSF